MKCTTILTIIILIVSIWVGYNWDTTQVHVKDLLARFQGSQTKRTEKAQLNANKHVEEPTEKLDIPVHWMAPFFSGGGYCSEAISFVSAIMNNLTYLSIEQHGDSMNQKFMDGLPNSDSNVIKQLYRSAQKNSISICHSEPGAWNPSKYPTSLCPLKDAVHKIGRTMFETDRIPSGWAERINGMDEVWVPTKFQAEVFEQNGVDPSKIVLMPEAVDVDFFNPEDMKMLDLDKFAKFYEEDLVEKFRFMSVFKWEKRKAWDVLLRAYLTEFSASEKVVLFIVTNPYHAKQKNEHLLQIQALKEQIAAELNKKIEDLPRVLVVDKHILQRRMPNLYKSAHVLIIPSRGEGWGRPHVEAMSMEVPVIATNWSGPTEFMTEENSFPLKINGLVPVGEGPFKDHMWADPSLEHLKERMRFTFSHPEEVEKRGKKAREDMVAKYSPRIIGDMVINRLKAIEQKLKK